MAGQPVAQPMVEPPMPPVAAASHDDMRQQPGMGTGNVDAEAAPVFGKRAAPVAEGGYAGPDRAALLSGAAEREERSERNWIQALAAHLGMSEAMAGVLVGVFVLVFLMKGVVPFLLG